MFDVVSVAGVAVGFCTVVVVVVGDAVVVVMVVAAGFPFVGCTMDGRGVAGTYVTEDVGNAEVSITGLIGPGGPAIWLGG